MQTIWRALPKRAIFQAPPSPEGGAKKPDAPKPTDAPKAGVDGKPGDAPKPEDEATKEAAKKALKAEKAGKAEKIHAETAAQIPGKSGDPAETQKLITQLDDRRKALNDKKNALRTEATSKNHNQESWVGHTGKTQEARKTGDGMVGFPGGPEEKAAVTIGKEVEKNYNDKTNKITSSIRDLLTKLGLQTPANEALIKNVVGIILINYMDSLEFGIFDKDKIQSTTIQYAEQTLLPNIEYALKELHGIFETKANDNINTPDKKRYPFQKPDDVIKAFAEFIQIPFFVNGSLQNNDGKNELYNFAVLTKPTLEGLISGFKKYLDHDLEDKQLEVSRGNLSAQLARQQAQKPDVAAMLARDEIKFSTIRISISPGETNIENSFRTAITGALDKNTDAAIAKEAVDIAMANYKKLNPPPKPGEEYTLSARGEIVPVDKKKEQEAQQAAEKATQTAADKAADNLHEEAASPKPSGPLAVIQEKIGGFVEMFGAAVVKFFEMIMKWLNKIPGFKESIKALKDIVKWTPVPAMLESMNKFYDEMKKLAESEKIKINHIYTLFENKTETERVMNSKPNNMSWSTFLAGIAQDKLKLLNEDNTLTAQQVADIILSGSRTESGNETNPKLYSSQDVQAFNQAIGKGPNKPAGWQIKAIQYFKDHRLAVVNIIKDDATEIDPEAKNYLKKYIDTMLEYQSVVNKNIDELMKGLTPEQSKNPIKYFTDLKSKTGWEKQMDQSIKDSKAFRILCLLAVIHENNDEPIPSEIKNHIKGVFSQEPLKTQVKNEYASLTEMEKYKTDLAGKFPELKDAPGANFILEEEKLIDGISATNKPASTETPTTTLASTPPPTLRTFTPAGYKRVTTVPADVVAAANAEKAKDKSLGTTTIYTGKDGKKYALVTEDHFDNHHKGGKGPPEVHPGVSALPQTSA